MPGLGSLMKDVPKEADDNRAWRIELDKECETSKKRQQQEREKCAEDLLYYVNAYVWQYNPQMAKGQIGPFVTYPFQDRVFGTIKRAMAEQHDLVLEKSKKMGLSWMCLIAMDHEYLFERYKQFLMISRSALAVDSPSPNSLFWKIDFMHKKLPAWLRPREQRTKMNYIHKDNGTSINGEASTGLAFVGGRAWAVFVDEAAFIEEMYQVWERSSDVSNCRIANSTHVGPTGCFSDLCDRTDGSVWKERIHWSENPIYNRGLYQYDQEAKRLDVLDKAYAFEQGFEFVMDGKTRSPWYDEQCKRKGSARAVATDLDIDRQGSMSQFFDPIRIRQLYVFCTPPYWEGDVRCDRHSGKMTALVPVKGGPLKLWCQLDMMGQPPMGRYAIGADISAGSGATNSCLSIVNGVTGEKIGEYANASIEARPMAALTSALGWAFHSPDGNGATIIWEMAGPGVTFAKKLGEMCYTNIFYRTDDLRTYPTSKEDRPGFYPSIEAKRLLLEEYRQALYDRKFLNRSQAALQEVLNFRYNARGMPEHANEASVNDPSGARTNHGDRAIADALAWKLIKAMVERKAKKKEAEVPLLSLAWRMIRHKALERESWQDE